MNIGQKIAMTVMLIWLVFNFISTATLSSQLVELRAELRETRIIALEARADNAGWHDLATDVRDLRTWLDGCQKTMHGTRERSIENRRRILELEDAR